MGRRIYLAIINPGMIIVGTPPDGTDGEAYSFTFTADGGTSPYTWAIIGGSLPDGLSLNSSTGEISGTPTSADDFSFTVEATDALGETATLSANVSIEEGAPLSFDETVVADGATWYWKLDETTGNFVDAINGLELVPSGSPDYEEPGMAAGTSVFFNPSNNEDGEKTINPLGDFADLGEAGSKYTIEWFGENTNTGTTTGPIGRAHWTAFELRGQGSSGNYEIPFNVGMNDGKAHFGRQHATAVRDTFDAGAINDLEPHHCIAVVDGTDLTMYVDGVDVGSTTLSNTSGGVDMQQSSTSAFITIGARRKDTGAPDNFWHGWLDGLAIYKDVALTAAQAADHHNKSIIGS